MPGIGDERYRHLSDRLVTPYRFASVKHRHSRAPDVLRMGDVYASTGMASSAGDLVRYAHSLDTRELLSAKAHALMTQPAVSTDGHVLPYGVGWFVQKHDDQKLVWHYGYGAADSALLVGVPEQKLTFVALANSDQMSACSLLGEGDLLTSPLAVSFVKHFVSPEKNPFQSPDFDAPTASVLERMDQLHQAGAPAIYDDEAFAQALIRDYLNRRDGRDESKALDLLRWLLRKCQNRKNRADIATLTLLARQSDPEILTAARPVLESLVAQQPENPAVLSAAVTLHQAMKDELAAVNARQQLANLRGYEDDPRKQEAAMQLGKYLSKNDADLASTYLWKAMTWSFNSGNGGDLGREIVQCLDDIRVNRKHAQKSLSPSKTD
jgi:hypothetical protein